MTSIEHNQYLPSVCLVCPGIFVQTQLVEEFAGHDWEQLMTMHQEQERKTKKFR